MSIQWSADLSVNNSSLDAEHKKIITMINALETAQGRPEEQRIVRASLADMHDYVLRHFRAEEDAMNLAGYRLLEPHRKTHNDFAQIVIDLNRRQDLMAEELRMLLTRWLTEHIMKVDRDYSEAVATWMASLKRKR